MGNEKCSKCGNLYSNEPDTDCKMCFRCILEEKDNRIKELEQQCLDLKEDNDATTESLYACRNYLDKVTSRMFDLEKEIERFDVKCRKAYQEGLLQKQFDKDAEIMLLKQSQNQKAIDVLTDILVNLCSKYFIIFDNHDESIRVLDVEQISDFINNQIKELRKEQ